MKLVQPLVESQVWPSFSVARSSPKPILSASLRLASSRLAISLLAGRPRTVVRILAASGSLTNQLTNFLASSCFLELAVTARYMEGFSQPPAWVERGMVVSA
ncbi:hypothetical protein D3C76_1517560 [compost metagenome]